MVLGRVGGGDGIRTRSGRKEEEDGISSMGVAAVLNWRRIVVVVVAGWLGGLVAAPIVLVFGPRRVARRRSDVVSTYPVFCCLSLTGLLSLPSPRSHRVARSCLGGRAALSSFALRYRDEGKEQSASPPGQSPTSSPAALGIEMGRTDHLGAETHDASWMLSLKHMHVYPQVVPDPIIYPDTASASTPSASPPRAPILPPDYVPPSRCVPGPGALYSGGKSCLRAWDRSYRTGV